MSTKQIDDDKFDFDIQAEGDDLFASQTLPSGYQGTDWASVDVPDSDVESQSIPSDEFKAVTEPSTTKALTDAELDALTDDFSEKEVNEAFALRTPAMQKLLGAKIDE